MSKKERLTITIPAYPTGGLEAARSEITKLGENRAPRSFKQAKQLLNELPNMSGGDLSKRDFFERAQKAIHAAEQAISKVPKEDYGIIADALDQAFLAGSLLTEDFLRETHILDVEREASQKKARQRGGESKRGHMQPTTKQVLKEMDEKIARGLSVSEAAHFAHRNGYGTSADANRNAYRKHRMSK